ncbi:S-adenosyl-L-methionine-dependent methyltransferase [Tribonema minus]|uniref:DNA (cytosine-5-)-methyltransferase n=1 Tax=Tribonema minus TaxID=303371 RepID=A0A836CC81_9STRA|nr:S-adenosyl-L-methionine-dependent methyltransferase [Tribonema minus]
MLHVIDLFCGAGGFSEGARQAGAVVVLAVDCWREALDVHAANHPDAEHWCEEIGTGDPAELAQRLRAFAANALPPGAPVHLHASPPCQSLSKANRASRDTSGGLRLTRFALDVIEAARFDSWTVEQVSAPAVRGLFDARGVLYRHLACDKLGVPSIRRRLIAASETLEDMQECIDRPLTLRQAMDRADMSAPPGFEVQRDGSTKDTRRRLDDVSYTVTTRSPILWNDARRRELSLSIATIKVLQTGRGR